MKQRNNLIIWLTMLGLAVLVAVLAWSNAPRPGEDAVLSIVKDGAVLQVWTMAQIQDLPAVELEKDIRSASHADERGVYRCVALGTLLDQTDPNWRTAASRIMTRAADGYVSTFTSTESGLDNNILVAYAKDGLPLGNLADGGTGPFRIIIRDDPFGTRATKYLIEIEVG